MKDSKCCPKLVLRLYNLTWLHHELVRDLLYNKTQSNTRLFGNYLHALTVHAPVQYETMCLLSVNAENQERLFSQAKRISLRATNRKVDNVLPTILLSIQARQKMADHKPLAMKKNTIVMSVAAKLPPFDGTTIEKAFVRGRLQSWQAHLERFSAFLKCGENIWWYENNSTYNFKDSDSEDDYNSQGPKLLHFCTTKLSEIQTGTKETWQKIIEQDINLPTPSIREFRGTRMYRTDNDGDQLPEITEEEFVDFADSNSGPHQTPEPQTETNKSTENVTTHTPSLTEEHHKNECNLLSQTTLSPDITSQMDTEDEITTLCGNTENLLEMSISPPVTATDSENEPQTSHFPTLDTKAARLILSIIGPTKTLVEFDNLRQRLKIHKH